MSLILCGFFCAGKSRIGKLCAEQLKLPFYDTDRMLEAEYNKNKSVAAIWQEIGCDAFRGLETKIIFSLEKVQGIISLGGGSLLREDNRTFIKNLGISVYLKASIESLYQRVLKRGYPAYLDTKNPFKHFEEIAQHRFPIYESHSHYMIGTDDLTEKEVLKKVCQIASERCSASPLGVNHTVGQ